ncbi:MAG TPA: response regulator [Vicinamibacterales bacterium]|nr:response regulator [Vicinamibacterales bacterium]
MEETLSPLSLLLVHTDSDDRAMYAEYLRREGFEVQEAGTTDAALPLVPHKTAVVTGMLVPGSIDTVEFIGRVRREWSTAVVVVTADSSPEHLEQVRAAGADAVLLKPCLPETLLDSIIDAIEANDARLLTPPARRRLSERRAGLRGGGRRDSDLS